MGLVVPFYAIPIGPVFLFFVFCLVFILVCIYFDVSIKAEIIIIMKIVSVLPLQSGSLCGGQKPQIALFGLNKIWL